MEIFDRCYAFVNGAVLGMADGGTLEYQGDPLPAATMTNELAGVTPVPKHAMISVENFVPSSGFEFDAIAKWLATEEVTFKLQFGGSGKVMTTSGYIMAPSLKYGAADATKFSFKALVRATPFN